MVSYLESYRVIRDIKEGLKYDVALIDVSLDGCGLYDEGMEIMEISKRINPNVSIISFSGWSFKPRFADYVIDKSISSITRLELLLKEILS